MGIPHSDLPTPQKILLLLKSNSGRNKGSLLVDPQKLSKQWNIPAWKISHCLNELRRAKKIKQCDDQGVVIDPHKRFSVGQAIVQIVLDEGGYIPWDKPNRRIYARIVGAKLSSLRLIVGRTGVLVVERNEYGWPTGLRIRDFKAAQKFIGDGKVALKTQHYGCHYYKYVRGYRPPRPPKEATQKPFKYTNIHRLLERVIMEGGDWWVRPIDVCKEFGFKRSSLYHHVKVLDGIISYENGRIRLLDPEKARLFLAPITRNVSPTTSVTRSSLLPFLSVTNEESTTASTRNNLVDAFVVHSNTRKQRPIKAATMFLLDLLLTRRRLEIEIAQRLVWYPRNYRLYGNGKEKMMAKYQEVKVHDEFTEDERRRQQGAMWGRQKAIVIRIINGLENVFQWPCIMGDELFILAVQNFKGALPTTDYPDHDIAEKVADWLEGELPDDEIAQDWIREFAECAGVEFMSEFLCRGGPAFLIYLMYRFDAALPAQEQGYTWYVHLTLAYANQHRFNPKHPEAFMVSINDAVKAVTDNTGWASGDTVIDALTRYLHYGGRLGSIRHRAYWITQRLNEVYPRRERDGTLIWHRVWDSIVSEDGRVLIEAIAASEDFDLLCDWMDKYTPKQEAADKFKPEKFTLRWYESKLKSAEQYGMPGDIESLHEKIRLIKEWPRANVKRQKNELVPALSKPDRYSDPRLNWQQWDMLIRSEL